jgi:hypothetical protein
MRIPLIWYHSGPSSSPARSDAFQKPAYEYRTLRRIQRDHWVRLAVRSIHTVGQHALFQLTRT